MWRTALRLFLISATTFASLEDGTQSDPEGLLVSAVSQMITRYGPITRDRFRSPLLVDSFALDRRTRQRQQDFLDAVLRSIGKEFPVQFHCTGLRSHRPERPVLHSLILIDGRHSFQKFFGDIDNHYDTSGIFWVVLYGASSSRTDSDRYELVRNILESLWRKQILYVFIFLFNEEDSVQLYSFFPYGENVCGFVEPVLLDWQKDRLFRSRLQQFYGCPLRVGTFENRPFIIITNDSQGHRSLSGFEGNLVNVISRQLNFSMTVVTPPNNDQFGYIGGYGNNTGLMKLLVDGSVDFGVGSLGLRTDRMALLSPGEFHYTTDMVFAVPSGRPLTAFEKLFLPLSTETWYVACAFFVCALITIAIVNVQRRKVREFVVGRSIRAPALNFINVLFGGPLEKCPGRNFARTLLMLWMLHTLVMRAVYQGSLYKYLQAPRNYSSPTTIAAVQRESLYFYMMDIDSQYFVNHPEIIDRVRYYSHHYSAIVEKMEQLARGDLDGALLVLEEEVAYHNRFHSPGNSIQITREVVCAVPIVLYYPKHSLLRRIFDQEIRKLRTTGLLEL
ncbi:uncharacterized protein LOC129716592 [Wyeomyia smithii]|uniref:uncharacterized protein LOC129716592 n=1 Tax=Wyeomyia smithii TaxID=174621 RepID=UPI002467B7C9|nr:uncharacterized protein LOC129716592 [Wyeomyia smithii]